MIIGAIFDWDGVVIDSSKAHEASWDRLAADERLPLPEGHFRKGFGRTNRVIIPDILGWTDDPAEIARLGAKKEDIYREIIKESLRDPLPGVREILADLAAAKIPCAIGSSTPRVNLDCALELMDLRGAFEAIVSGDDVKNSKPDPEVFLKAASRIGKPPSRCVVFEDAFYGVEAGVAGGFKVVGVTTGHTSEELKARGADMTIDSFENLDVSTLMSLFKSSK